MRRQARAGTTVLEVSLMGLVMSVLLVMITQSISSLSQTRAEQRQHANIGNIADRIARQIENDVAFAARIFTDNAVDNAWLQAMAVGTQVVAAGRLLPVQTQYGLFQRDPDATRETGNVVFLASRRDRIAIDVKTLLGASSTYYAQNYLFYVYAPVAAANGDTDLLRWVSTPVLAYWDLQEIADPTERAAAIAGAWTLGFRYAWDPRAAVATGLFAIQQAGSMTAVPTGQCLPGAEDARLSRTLVGRRMRIAGNGSVPQLPIPEFAVANAGFPGGLEVKFDGSTAGKLMLFRLVIESVMANKRKVFSEVRRVITSEV